MDLKDMLMSRVRSIFGTKRLTTVLEIEQMELLDSELVGNASSEFERNLKVKNAPQISKNYFFAIKEDARQEIWNNLLFFKDTILSSDEMKRIKEAEETGEIGGTAFICTAEMGSDGKIQSTIIATKNSCSRLTTDSDGNKCYQESRMVNGRMQTIINDEKQGSLLINGNFNQAQIDKIRKFSNSNVEKMSNIKEFESESEKAAYIHVLQQRGAAAQVDVNDKEKYSTGGSGRVSKEDGTLSEVNFVFDKNKQNQPPVIISLNRLKGGKLSTERFRLTEDGKYIDENSFRLNENGNPEYTEVSFEQLREYGNKNGFDMGYITKIQRHHAMNKDMIPQGALEIQQMLAQRIQQKNRENEANIINQTPTSFEK